MKRPNLIPNTRHATRFWPALLFAGLGLLCAACGRQQEGKAETIAEIQKREGIPVSVLSVQEQILQAEETAGGTVEGYYQTQIKSGSPVPSAVQSILVQIGDIVKANQTIMRLDPEAAGSPFRIAKAQYETAQKSIERARRLAQEGALSQDMLDQAETGYTAARVQFDGANQSVNVLAPFTGTIVALHQPENRIVGPGALLADIAVLSKIRISLSINESIIQRFQEGQTAYIVSPSDTVWGKVTRVAIAGSKAGHSFSVETVFKNTGKRLKPGMFVTVHTIVEQRAQAIGLPVDVIISEGDEHYVYVVRDGAAHKVPVELGIRAGGQFEILQGLSQGDEVVITGASALSSGIKIRIVD